MIFMTKYELKMAMSDTYYSLLTCEKLMDALQSEMLSTAQMMGGLNSAYEAMTDEEKQEYSKKTKQLKNLVACRMTLLDDALNELQSNANLEIVEEFSFSGENNNQNESK